MQESKLHNQEEGQSDQVTHAEVSEAIRIWSETRKGAPADVGASTVNDLAEGLEISHELARALIKEVREGKAAFRELPVSAAVPEPLDVAAYVSLGLAGGTLLGALAGIGELFLLAGAGLILSLLYARRWVLAAAACFLLLGVGFFVTGTTATRNAVVIESPSPVPTPIEVPAPPPAPALPPLPR